MSGAQARYPWSTDRKTAEREYHRDRRAAAHAAGNGSQRARDLLRRYGITEADYDQMRAEQDYRCAICGTHERDLPPTRAGRRRADGTPPKVAPPLAVDHCHESGRVRGLLCHPCNHGLGRFADDPTRIVAAAEYLTRRYVK